MNLWSRCDCGSDFVRFPRDAEESMIQKRCKNRDNSNDDERADAIKLIELRKVVKEKFHDGDPEQAETRVTDRCGSFAHAHYEQKQGEQRPGDAVTHVPRKISCEFKRQRGCARSAEVIGDLDVHQEEGEHGAERVKQRQHTVPKHAMPRRREQLGSSEQTDCRNAVGVKIPVKNRERGARMITEHGWIESEAREHGHEQCNAGQSQSWMRDTMKKPAERCAFQGPANGDPLSIELDRKNQRNEKQRRTAEERQLRIAGRADERCGFEQYEQSEQRRHRKCGRHETRDPVRVGSANQLIQEVKVQRPSQRGRSPRHSFLGKPAMENERKRSEERIESEIPKQGEARLRRIKMLEVPCVFERQNGNKRNCRQHGEQKEFAHSEKQND